MIKIDNSFLWINEETVQNFKTYWTNSIQPHSMILGIKDAQHTDSTDCTLKLPEPTNLNAKLITS